MTDDRTAPDPSEPTPASEAAAKVAADVAATPPDLEDEAGAPDEASLTDAVPADPDA